MTGEYFTFDTYGEREGPFDLVTMMKRIKSGKLNESTLVFAGDAAEPQPAGEMEDFRVFFTESPAGQPETPEPIMLRQWLIFGWTFMTTHQALTVYAGAIVLLCFMLSLLWVERLGWGVGITLGVMSYWMMQSVAMVCSLRLNRGQYINAEFVRQSLVARFFPLLFSAAFLAILMVTGLLLAIVPGILLLTLYIFTPLFIADGKTSIFEGMSASRRLTCSLGWRGFCSLFTLMAIYTFATVTVIFIPLVFPVITGVIAEIFDHYAPQVKFV